MATCENTCLTEEQPTGLIKTIFTEQFERQQKNILNINSGNFDIQMIKI